MICSCVVGNAICTFMIYLSHKYYLFVIIRFFNGFFTVFFAIYTPVWIDQFIPLKDKSVFMAFQNLESVFGTILGMILTSRLSLVISWRYSFLIQAFLLFGLSVFPLLVSSHMYSRTTQRIDNDEKFIIKESIQKIEKDKRKAYNNTNFLAKHVLKDSFDKKESIDDSTLEIYNELKVKDEGFSTPISTETNLANKITLKEDDIANESTNISDNFVSTEELSNYKKEVISLTYIQIIKQLITNYVSKFTLKYFIFFRFFYYKY